MSAAKVLLKTMEGVNWQAAAEPKNPRPRKRCLELHEISVRISRSMGCRRLRQLLVRWKRASDVIERRLALDLKESDLLAAARPAFKGAGVDRRPVFSEVFSKRKGTVRRWPFGQIARRGSPPRPQAAEPGASMGSWRMVAR